MRILSLVGLFSLVSAGYWGQVWHDVAQGSRSSLALNPFSTNEVSVLETTQRIAFATLLYNTNDHNIALVRAMFKSIASTRMGQDVDYVVFVIDSLSAAHEQLLKGDGLTIQSLDLLDLPWAPANNDWSAPRLVFDVREDGAPLTSPIPSYHASWRFLFSKIQLFSLTNYERVIILDADITVQQDPSFLEQDSEMCPQWAGLCMIEEGAGYGNCGVMVIKPNAARYADLMEAYHALQASQLVLRYAEQDFLNIYSMQSSSFMVVMPISNNCPGNCGDLQAPFPAGCYLQTPHEFPFLHFCGKTKPSMCTDAGASSHLLDFCLSPAVEDWLDTFYALNSPCGSASSCSSQNPTPAFRQRKQSVAGQVGAAHASTLRLLAQKRSENKRVTLLSSEYPNYYSLTWRLSISFANATEAWQESFRVQLAGLLSLSATDPASTVNIVGVTQKDGEVFIEIELPSDAARSNAKVSLASGAVLGADHTYTPPATEAKKASNTGMIIGIVIGCLALVVLVVCAIRFSKGDAKPSKHAVEMHGIHDGVDTVTGEIVADDKDLPPGWRLIPNDGNPYYWNDDREESTWEKPTA